MFLRLDPARPLPQTSSQHRHTLFEGSSGTTFLSDVFQFLEPTSGCGFLGRHLVTARFGVDVTPVGRSTPLSASEPTRRELVLDTRDRGAVTELLAARKIDTVFDLAAITEPGPSQKSYQASPEAAGPLTAGLARPITPLQARELTKNFPIPMEPTLEATGRTTEQPAAAAETAARVRRDRDWAAGISR